MNCFRLLKELLRLLLSGIEISCLRCLRRNLPRFTMREWSSCQPSFSQCGEDRILAELLRDYPPETYLYVDVGAFDPIRYSNTLLLHRIGWRGINIDANERSIRKFCCLRPKDRNLHVAVGGEYKKVLFCEYAGVATNRIRSPSDTDLTSLIGEPPVRLSEMTTRSLNDILRDELRAEERIGFLNIDCEGEDWAILNSFDWTRWRPRVVAVEAHADDVQLAMTKLMDLHGYRIAARCLFTLVFERVLPP
jgi:hypothetical protein